MSHKNLMSIITTASVLSIAKWSLVGASFYEPIIPLIVLDSLPYLTTGLDHPKNMLNNGFRLYQESITNLNKIYQKSI